MTKVWEKFDQVREAMNNDSLLVEEIAKALSADELEETLDWISQCWELDPTK